MSRFFSTWGCRTRFWVFLLLFPFHGAWAYTFTQDPPVKWAPGPVRIDVKMGTSGQPLRDGKTSWNDVIQEAMDIWNTSISGIELVPSGNSQGPNRDGDGINQVYFSSTIGTNTFPRNVLAVTTSWKVGTRRVEADVIFNTAFTWDSYRGARSGGPFDLRRVALHELGHVLGLDHPDQAQQHVSAQMNSVIGDLDSLTADDRAGGAALYPNLAPVIVRPPARHSALVGSDTSFTVSATGSQPLFFQWNFNGSLIAGETNVTLLLINVRPENAGAYGVTVANVAGSTNSAPATLGVLPDNLPPRVVVQAPLPSARLFTVNPLVFGTASDNAGLESVLWRVGGGEFVSAVGTRTWSQSLSLSAGTNVIQVKSVDRSGNESPVATRQVFVVVTNALVLQTSGAGTVTPNLNGRFLEIGRGYRVVALPARGNWFAGWTGDVASDDPRLDFIMRTNLVLQARFVPNPFVPVAGTYNGLFLEAGGAKHETSGYLTITVGESRVYSGRLLVGGESHGFRGIFDLSGHATNRLARPGRPELIVVLTLDLTGGTDQARGTISDGTWTSDLLADRLIYDGRTRVAALAGRYTVVLPSPGTGPDGSGFGNVTVTTGGRVFFSGLLGDNTGIAQWTTVSRDGNWPFYAGLYGGRGSIVGWLPFADNASDDLEGPVTWTKPGPLVAVYYPEGFTNVLSLSGSRYQIPPVGERVVAITQGLAGFTGGSLVESWTNRFTLGSNNRVTILDGTNRLSLGMSVVNGRFSGRFTHPVTGRGTLVRGVVLQKSASGGGSFVEPNRTGAVTLAPE